MFSLLLQRSLISSTSILKLSLSFLYLEKTTEHDFSTDIFIFHLISHSSSSLVNTGRKTGNFLYYSELTTH
ncbi:hypothetical protein BpHYR1_025807 [Brachionus plicatilis]|uniref:Uncharacterized protein n=1 Tax=Brachionus plicatilis TaxID=10195 RepID=A0A3M7PPG0_BRAPC|nr:hypothetical protein BpHYR1_025807 [Brachionus plicatilis]